MNRPPSSVVIPMITFIEGEMEIPMIRITRYYLINYRLTPPNAPQTSLGSLGV